MAHKIFIVGTDSEKCKELRTILQEQLHEPVAASTVGGHVPGIEGPGTVIITAEDDAGSLQHQHLLMKLEDQVRRADFLSELIRLFGSSLQLGEILEKVAEKSTDVLGDTAFIILNSQPKPRLEAAFCKDRDRLIRMLVAALGAAPEILPAQALRGVLEDGSPIVVPNIQQSTLLQDAQPYFEKYGIVSMLATPIRTKDAIHGAFVSLATPPRTLTQQDLARAIELADFTAMALENSRLFQELQRCATTDSLTGVYNTRFLNEVLAREAARSQRYSTPLSLLMIDVDNFKTVNDTFGHLVGNKVLTEIAAILGQAVRNTDFVFRCGGDEFAVILPGTTLEGAMRVAEKIHRKVESGQILETAGYSGPITVSIGVSEYEKGNHFETLVAEADQALYGSKRSFGNCVRAYSR